MTAASIQSSGADENRPTPKLSRFAQVTAVAVVLVGVAVIVTSGLLQSHPWPSSLLLNLGVAIFLAIPLVVVTRIVSTRIEQSEQRITDEIEQSEQRFADEIEQIRTDTDQKIAELTQVLDARSTVHGWAESGGSAADLPIMEQIGNLLDSGILSKHGFIVPFFELRGIYIQIAADDARFQITPLDANEIDSMTTTPKVNALTPVSVVRSATLNDMAATVLESIGDKFPIAKRLFNPAEFETTMQSHVHDLAKVYRDRAKDDSEGLRMIVNDQWALADDTLFARAYPAYAELDRPTAGGWGWRPFLVAKTWVDGHQLNEGFRWAYALRLTTAAAVEGDSKYDPNDWHPSARLTD